MRLLHAEIITDLLSSSTAQPGTGSTRRGSVTQRSAVPMTDALLLFWCSQENAMSTRTPCQLSRRGWRAWNWCCHRILTTKSALLGARSWPGWRMWLQFLLGECKQIAVPPRKPGPSSPQLPPGVHEGVPGLVQIAVLECPSNCTCSRSLPTEASERQMAK